MVSLYLFRVFICFFLCLFITADCLILTMYFIFNFIRFSYSNNMVYLFKISLDSVFFSFFFSFHLCSFFFSYGLVMQELSREIILLSVAKNAGLKSRAQCC